MTTESRISTRFLDADKEPLRALTPIEGYEKKPLVSLEEAVRPLRHLLHNLDNMVSTAKWNTREPQDNLTPDESAAIHLYTMQWQKPHSSLYILLNQTLRSEQRIDLIPWFLYLKLLLTALYKLPSIKDVIWRGIRGDVIPLRSTNIDTHARWIQNGLTVAGDNQQGNSFNQLNRPCGLFVDYNQSVYIVDRYNHRIMEWKYGETSGRVVAGGNGRGNENNQLSLPTDIIIDTNTDSLIICDAENRRVVRWPCRGGTNGETIISNVDCFGLTMDDNGFLYISDDMKNEIRRWRIGDTHGELVAGGNGKGNGFNQFNRPTYIFIDKDHSLYVSDHINRRVMKWMKGATEGIEVVGGCSLENDPSQLSRPRGIVVDQLGTIYVADFENHRIMCWLKGVKQGNILVGGNGKGRESNQFDGPNGLSFDRQGNLYVVDCDNNRVQRFNIDLGFLP
ncbi:unnamed protein product [Rotaria sordida]|uniref:Uncharacterized protein n=1 Tax=Rotaria sordida TaxID=392033 RepID=A0A818VK97_9BILA|nr:unnamed protein product [Rotaria sordida]CAF3713165.1 unnamed protein product [Rotaria sordida]